MPFDQYIKFNDGSFCGCWVIAESIEELWQDWTHTEGSLSEWDEIKHEEKKREFLAVRLLLQRLCLDHGIQYQGIQKDEHGKPFLINLPWHISFTHAQGIAAVAMHPNHSIGLDIELMMQKLRDVQSKFLSEEETSFMAGDTAKLCIAWSAKEATIKMIGKKGVSLRNHISILPFELKKLGNLVIQVHHPDFQFQNEVFFQKMGNFYLSIVSRNMVY